MTEQNADSASKCPVMGTTHQAVGGTANQHWWPNQLNLRILRQNPPQADPNGDPVPESHDANGRAALRGRSVA